MCVTTSSRDKIITAITWQLIVISNIAINNIGVMVFAGRSGDRDSARYCVEGCGGQADMQAHTFAHRVAVC